MNPPVAGQLGLRRCRGHYHVITLVGPTDEYPDELDSWDVTIGASFEQASEWLLQEEGKI